MDKLQEFFKELKDRASNPFISSFIISAALQLETARLLAFYDNAALSQFHHTNHIELVAKTVKGYGAFGYPLITALSYTFIWPIIRSYIKAFHTIVNTRSENWNSKLSGKTLVEITTLRALQDEVYSQEKSLSELFGKEKESHEKMAKLRQEYNYLMQEANKYKADLQSWIDYNNVKKLDGEWKVERGKVINKEFKYEKAMQVKIQEGQILYFDIFGDRAKKEAASIIQFSGNPSQNSVQFTINSDNDFFKTESAVVLIVANNFNGLNSDKNIDSDEAFAFIKK